MTLGENPKNFHTPIYIFTPRPEGGPGLAWGVVDQGQKSMLRYACQPDKLRRFPHKNKAFHDAPPQIDKLRLYSAPGRGIGGKMERTPRRAFDCLTPRPARLANRRINGAMNKHQIISALISDQFKNACDNQLPFADKVIESINALSTPERREILRHVTAAGANAIPGNLSYNYSTQEWVD